jgi:hypothetical protein
LNTNVIIESMYLPLLVGLLILILIAGYMGLGYYRRARHH